MTTSVDRLLLTDGSYLLQTDGSSHLYLAGPAVNIDGGSLTPSGSMSQRTSHNLTGTLTPLGVMQQKSIMTSLAGRFIPKGLMEGLSSNRNVFFNVVFAPSGDLTKATSTSLPDGNLGLSTAFTRLISPSSFTAILSPIGAISKQINTSFDAILDFATDFSSIRILNSILNFITSLTFRLRSTGEGEARVHDYLQTDTAYVTDEVTRND